MTVLKTWKISRKVTAVDSCLGTVKGLAILLKQDPTTDVFVKTLQNFQNRYFLCNTSTAASEFIDNSQSCCPLFPALPALLVCRDKMGRRVEQFRNLSWKFSWLTIHWESRNALIQSNIVLADIYQRWWKNITMLMLWCWCCARKENFHTLSSYFWLNDMNSLPQNWQMFMFLSSLSLWMRH